MLVHRMATAALMLAKLPLICGSARAIVLRLVAPIMLRMRKVLDSYRPELHYMRGPGPRWRQKHGECGVNGEAPLERVVFAATSILTRPGDAVPGSDRLHMRSNLWPIRAIRATRQ
jgi:hypothetical protein